jgi:hypothetical protein
MFILDPDQLGITLVDVSSNTKVFQGTNDPPQLVKFPPLNLGYIYCLVSGLGIFLSALDTQARPCVKVSRVRSCFLPDLVC